MDEEHLSSLERVRRKLYSNNAPATAGVEELSQKPAYETKGWEKLKVEQITKVEAPHMSGPTRFLITAFGFFVLTLAGTGAYLYFGGRSVSTSNVKVLVQGPATIASGDTVPLTLAIENRNPTSLKDVTVTVTYPPETKDPSDPTKPLTSYVENVGDLGRGERIEKTIRASVFGSEGSRTSLPIKIQYKTDSSTSVFEIHKQYDFTVTSSPLALTATALSQVTSGQTLTVEVAVKNNATNKLENVAISAEYPFGFTVISTDPKVTAPFFYLGALASGEERKIRIQGVVSGEDKDQRVFRVIGGVASSPTATALVTAYSNKEITVGLTKPFLATTLSVQGDSSENPVVNPGVPASAVVSWQNNLNGPVTNAQVSIVLGGEALDPSSVQVSNGFYRSSDSTVIFTGATNPSLKTLAQGASGQGSFRFATKKPAQLGSLRSPVVTMAVSIAGQRVGQSNVPETVSSTVSRTVRVGTNVALTSRAVRTIGPISNTGPWPPSPNKETTYTVQFTLTNNFNSVGGAKVTATLPEYIRYTGKVSPNDGSLSYDEASRAVTWNVGDVGAGTASKTMSFQVGFTPSISQSGSPATLVNTQTFSGVDRFTQKQIQGTVGEITTEIKADPAYTTPKGSVQ